MSVAERVLGTWRVQSLPEMGEWIALEERVGETWGWFPALMLVNALGLLAVAFANSAALAGAWGAEVLFWLGLLLMIVPSAVRMVTPTMARRERIAIVVGLGLAFYLVKVLHSPLAFTFSDEFVHLFNTNQILQQKVLFTANPVLQVTPMFPGLPALTAALATVTGLPVFAAGLLVIGVARLVLLLAFYLFVEQISCSPRIAGLAALFFMGNNSFLFWNAQFSYESLTLPLALTVIYLIARREGTDERSRYLGLSALALLGIGAIVITHHLTSYILATVLLVWWLFVQVRLPDWLTKLAKHIFLQTEGKLINDSLSNFDISSQSMRDRAIDLPTTTNKPEEGPQGLALFALIGALAWLVYVAILTVSYLSPVFSKGLLAMLQLILGEGEGRSLFVSTTGDAAPLWERVVSVSAVLLSLLALPFGLTQLWQRARQSALALILAIASVSYFAVLGLRFTTASWEISNRASTYLFIGLAFVLAMAVDRLWTERWQNWPGRALFAAGMAVIFAGGIIAGWPPQLRLAHPYLVTTGHEIIAPQGRVVAEWMRSTLGPGHPVAADEANGRYLLAYGEQKTYIGRFPYVRDIVTKPNLDLWQLGVMQQWDLAYVVVDRRQLAWDNNNMLGYFFNRTGTQQAKADWFAPEVYEKYDHVPGVSRVMDSGDIVIYDVEVLHNEQLTR